VLSVHCAVKLRRSSGDIRNGCHSRFYWKWEKYAVLIKKTSNEINRYVSKLLSQSLYMSAWRNMLTRQQTEKTVLNKKTLEKCKDKLCARCNKNPRFHGASGDKYSAYCVGCQNNKAAK
jgi:hypothetical protein